MTVERWSLVNFEPCLRRWVETEAPPTPTIKRVAEWITDNLPINPHLRFAKRFNEDPTMRYVEMPFKSGSGRIVVIGYKLDMDAREIFCVILGEYPGNMPYG